MSSRKSTSGGEGLPSVRCGERPPLRSLENEMLHLSTPSTRAKSVLHDTVKMSKADDHHCEREQSSQSPTSNKVMKTNAFNIDASSTETACGFGDVTFKSFICPGGEVEIIDSSLCAEESIVLPKDQAMTNSCETEDTLISDSMIVKSCSDHKEHPYHNPEVNDASQLACLCEMSNATLASQDLEDKSVTAFQHDFCGEKDISWKSFACEGGEVEFSDVTRLQDETILLPEPQLREPLQDTSLNSTNLSDVGQLCQAEHADHPYCGTGNDVCVTATNGSEEPGNGLSDVTFKSFNCTGGEIQISDGTKLADETVPLPAHQIAVCSDSYNYGIEASMLAGHNDALNTNDHLDHKYCKIESCPSTPGGNPAITQEPLPLGFDVVVEVKQMSLEEPNNQTNGLQGIAFSSSVREVEESDGTGLTWETCPPPNEQAVICQAQGDTTVPPSKTRDNIQETSEQPDGVPTLLKQTHDQDNDECPNSRMEKNEVQETDPPAFSTSSQTNMSALDDKSVNSQMQETSKKDYIHPEGSRFPTALHQTESFAGSNPASMVEIPEPVEVHLGHLSGVQLSSETLEAGETKPIAPCSSGHGPVPFDSTEKPHPENLPDVLRVLSECSPVASVLQSRFFSPILRSASLFALKSNKDPAVQQFLADDFALEHERSLLAPVTVSPTGLWGEHLESPLPRPLFNSTVLGPKAKQSLVTEPVEDVDMKPCAVPQPDVEKPVLDIPLISEGPLQQQLRQMAEFLFLASGKMGPTAAPVPPPAAVTVPSQRAIPAESHSVCVGTSPMKAVDRSVNTSGQFERKREFSVTDSCTLTDPLLWNVPPGSLECLPKQELEQRLRSSMIMVEALLQQVTTARTHGCPAGPAPSDLREKLVQTDHTELGQTTMHRDLYLEALSRIAELEPHGNSLQNLIQCIQDMRVTTTSLSRDTDAALSNMKQMGDVVREDHQSLVSHYGQMKSLFAKTKETQTRMVQKVKDVLHQRDDMRTQMEEAFTAKEAAFSAMEQLRTHSATEISQLERMVGSQQDLSAALNRVHPELVALNQTHAETMNSALDLLSSTIEEQSSLMNELCTVGGFVQRTAPMLLRLNEKAAAALRERDEQISAREQAVEEREQMEEEWNQTNMNLQAARERIGDLNLQVTIMTSEMGVLRQKLTERDEERGQLERKVTELSATVSSTLASYSFLEQALAAETTKLQKSWKDIQLTKDRANELETSLGQSEQRVCELSQALAVSEEQLGQLQALSQSQNVEIQQLQELCTQRSGVQEMNEFLQMENELAREQMAESECLLKANLQGLRERNIQCEDLKGELGQLQLENRTLQEELETTKSRASATQRKLGDELAQMGTEITLLHHTLQGLTNELQAALNDQEPEPLKNNESQSVHKAERRHPSSSFVDSIMVALAVETEEDVDAEASPGPAVPSDVPEPPCETLFSQTSAFTRVATPRKKSGVESEPEEDEQSSVAKLFAGLDGTVTELISTLKLVRQRNDAQLEKLHNTICSQQVEQQAANNQQQAKLLELKQQLSSLDSLVERGRQALQQKAQDEKTVATLVSDIQETQEILTKHKTENNELRKDVVELRRSLQEATVESQFLRGELRKAGGQSAPPAHFMEEKIQLLKEVQRLKSSLHEEKLAREKLLDRAKRHQSIHQINQQKSENELQLLNDMISKVRETLLSLPDVVKKSKRLQQLIEHIG